MDNKRKVVELMEKLISLKSVSGKEHDISIYLYDYLGDIGFKPRLYEAYKGGENIVIELGHGYPSLLIEAHMDVVPEFDMKNAFKPLTKDGKIYGRGASDTKGGIASILLALEEIAGKNLEPDRKVTIAFTVDEELYGRGAKDLLIHGIRGDYGVIIEPTNLYLCTSISGCIEFKINSTGLSGHGAAIDSGVNAIYPLLDIIKELTEIPFMKEKGSKRFMQNILNVGVIEGGLNPWVVPPNAEAIFLLHFIPSYKYDDVSLMLERFVKEKNKQYKSKISLEVIHGCDGYSLPSDDPMVNNMLKVASLHTGREDAEAHFTSECDANELYHKGGVRATVFGPGDISTAHSSYEYVKIKDILTASNIIRDIMLME
jgi:acetylornithine deacetylase/succinyl-diaminopimelate desuccinylase family protein